MSDELRARLDAAIMAARETIEDALFDGLERTTTHDHDYDAACPYCIIDRYTALVELRARWEVLDRRGCERRSKTGTCIDKGFEAPCFVCRWEAEIEADVRRLLAVDGPTEAHSDRNDDQPSG